MSSKTKLSIIIPFYNESSNLKKLHSKLIKVLSKLKFKSEIIYIDDGSKDGGVNILTKITKKRKNISIKILKLPKHSGQTKAISKGISQANGELVSFLDADLQNDSKDLITMVNKIAQGYDAVFGWRKNRKDSLSKKLSSKLANFLIRIFFKTSLHDVGCSIKVVKREVLLKTLLFGQSHRILPLLIIKGGAKTTEIVVNHKKRTSSKSKYNYTRTFNLIIDLARLKFSS